MTQDGTLGLTIPADAILDLAGVGNAAYSASYIVQVDSQPYPTPLTAKETAGILIYDPTVIGCDQLPGRQRQLHHQTWPPASRSPCRCRTDPGLTGTISLSGPGGPIGSATASGPGANVVLESAPVTTAGIYTFTVTGTGSGNYTLQAVLNAYVKTATDTNNSLGSAVDLSSSFIALGTANGADRAGVLGTIDAVRRQRLLRVLCSLPA